MHLVRRIRSQLAASQGNSGQLSCLWFLLRRCAPGVHMIALRLVVLAMIWGSSFLFQRVAVPELGTGLTAGGRIALAALALWAIMLVLRRPLDWRAHWREY